MNPESHLILAKKTAKKAPEDSSSHLIINLVDTSDYKVHPDHEMGWIPPIQQNSDSSSLRLDDSINLNTDSNVKLVLDNSFLHQYHNLNSIIHGKFKDFPDA